MKSYLVFSILLLLIFISCNQRDKKQYLDFSQVEAVIWQKPDSALFILRSIPQSSLSGNAEYATWGLLLVQARDEVYGSYLPDSLNEPRSDDLVQNALVYFEGTDNLKRKAQAYFYKGQLLVYKNEYTDAVHYYLRAKCIMELQLKFLLC